MIFEDASNRSFNHIISKYPVDFSYLNHKYSEYNVLKLINQKDQFLRMIQTSRLQRRNTVKNMLSVSKNYFRQDKRSQFETSKISNYIKQLQKNIDNLKVKSHGEQIFCQSGQILTFNQKMLRRNRSEKHYNLESFVEYIKQTDKYNLPSTTTNFQVLKNRKNFGYDRLTDKMLIMDKKFLQIKNGIKQKKQQKQKMIRQQIISRQKIQHQRDLNYQKKQLTKQKQQLERKNNIKLNDKQNQQQKFQFTKQYSVTLLKQNFSVMVKQNTQNSHLIKKVSSPKSINLYQIKQKQKIYNDYYVKSLIESYKIQESQYLAHLNKSLYYIKLLQLYSIPTQRQIQHLKINLSQKESYLNKKTLIFDLDETLIHYNNDPNLNKLTMEIVSVKLKSGAKVNIEINVRPYARNILKNLHKEFQIIIFTASQSTYADPIINLLDPTGQYISHRLYRQHCYKSLSGLFIKDLRIINRQSSSIILVDNSAYSYFFQLQNAIPIIPYFHGNLDAQLKRLELFAREISKQKDVRQRIRDTFEMHRYKQFRENQVRLLIEKLYLKDCV